MNLIEKILDEAKSRNGIITSRIADELDFPRAMLAYLVSKGRLEKSGRGVYTLPHVFDDVFFSTQSRYRKGIISHDSALFLHQLTDRTPYQIEMTFPLSYNVKSAKAQGIRCYRTSSNFYSIGIDKAITPSGNEVVVYSPERTICDVFRYVKVPSDEEIKALKFYMRRPGYDVTKLMQIAQFLRVERVIRPYIETILEM